MVANLGPETLSRALAAAVIAGMTSVRRAVVAGVAIGILQNVLTYNFLAVPGLSDLLLFLVVLVAVAFYGRTLSGEAQVFAFTPKIRPVPERLRSVWWIRHIDKGGVLLLGAIAILLPARHHQTLQPAALHRGPRVRDLRVVADHRDRVAGAAVARPDGLRGDRRALRGPSGGRGGPILGRASS